MCVADKQRKEAKSCDNKPRLRRRDIRENAEPGEPAGHRHRYAAGDSYSRIAAALEKTGCPYSEGVSRWNKNMVGRILQNRKYLGQDGYPILVTEYEFGQAALLQQKKFTRKDIRTAPEVAALKGKVTCGDCGTAFRRVTWSKRGKKKIVWRCISRLDYGTKYCKKSPTVEEGQLHAAILRAINAMMSNREKLVGILRTNLAATLSEKNGDTVNPLVIENIKPDQSKYLSTVYIPYDYWYTVSVERDHHVDFDNVPEKVAALLNHCYPDQPELKNDGQQEGGPNPDQQNSPVMG